MTTTWSSTFLILGLVSLGIFFVLALIETYRKYRETQLTAKHEDDLRQLVHRYETLAENTLKDQQRIATDMSALLSRTTSIEQILRTVE